ncbi:type II toxin-antitoxin system RelE/ParE family toxin [Caballeronia insecticola]|uniref:Phage derived protein Gp49-like protein n=1 Tax=Caballeronia insecticola TaxID=758793 RepID=R4WVJ1_9BURK|nr:type II toxin-antitoxin system RelE/ParE family toxin [Caballeronia insecticola]BAN21917.1 phage derived protein Gp49-like protein [Caballeronia insecticola]
MLTSADVDAWAITYYSERIAREISELPVGIFAGYLRLLSALKQHGPDLGMPYSRSLGDKLFELRPAGREGIARVFYGAMQGKRIIMLHSFIKKTQRTPPKELRLARNRLMEAQRNG